MLLMVLLFTVVGDFIEPVPTIIIFMPLVNTLTQAGDIIFRAYGRGADRNPRPSASSRRLTASYC